MPELPVQPNPLAREAKPLYAKEKYEFKIDLNDPSWARIVDVTVNGRITISAGKSTLDEKDIGTYGLYQGREKGKGKEPPPAPAPKEEEPREIPPLITPLPGPEPTPEREKKVPTEHAMGIAPDPEHVTREENNRVNEMMRIGQQRSSLVPLVGPFVKHIAAAVWQNNILSPLFREREANWVRDVINYTGLSHVPTYLILEAKKQGNHRISQKRNPLHRVIDRAFNFGANIAGRYTTNQREEIEWIKEQAEMARGQRPVPEGEKISEAVLRALEESAKEKESLGQRIATQDSADGVVKAIDEEKGEYRHILGEKGERKVEPSELEAEKQLAVELRHDFIEIFRDFLDGKDVSEVELRRRMEDYASEQGYKASDGKVYKLRDKLSGKYEIFKDKLAPIGNNMVRLAKVLREYREDYVKQKFLGEDLNWEKAFAEGKLNLKIYIGEGEMDPGEVEGDMEKLARRLRERSKRVPLSAREHRSYLGRKLYKFATAVGLNEITAAAVGQYTVAAALSILPTNPTKFTLWAGGLGTFGLKFAEMVGVSHVPVMFNVTPEGLPVAVPLVFGSAVAAGAWAAGREFLRLRREKSSIEYEAAHGKGQPAAPLVEPGGKGRLASWGIAAAKGLGKVFYGSADREAIMEKIAHQRSAVDLVNGLTAESELFSNPGDLNSEFPEGSIDKIEIKNVQAALRWLAETQARLDILRRGNRFVIGYPAEVTDAQVIELLTGASIAVEERLIHLFKEREDLRRHFDISKDETGRTNFKEKYDFLKALFIHNLRGDTALPKGEEFEKLVRLVGDEEVNGEKTAKGFVAARESIGNKDKSATWMFLRIAGHRLLGTTLTGVAIRDAYTQFMHDHAGGPPSYILGHTIFGQGMGEALPELPTEAAVYHFGDFNFKLPKDFSFDADSHVVAGPDHAVLVDLDDLAKAGHLNAAGLGKAITEAMQRQVDISQSSEPVFAGSPTTETIGHTDITLPSQVSLAHHADVNGHEVIDQINIAGKPPISLQTELGYTVDTTNADHMRALEALLEKNKLEVELKPDGTYIAPTEIDTQTFGPEHPIPTPAGTHWEATAGQPPEHFDLVDSDGKHLFDNAYFDKDGKFIYTDQSGGLVEVAAQGYQDIDKVISDSKWIGELRSGDIVYGANGIGFRVENLQGDHGILKLFNEKGEPINLGVTTPNMPRDVEIDFQAGGKPPLITYDGITQNTVPDNLLNALRLAGANSGGKFADSDFWPPRISDDRWSAVYEANKFENFAGQVTRFPATPAVPWHPNPASGEAFPYTHDHFPFISHDGKSLDASNFFAWGKVTPDGKGILWPSGTVSTPPPEIVAAYKAVQDGVPGAAEKWNFFLHRAGDPNAIMLPGGIKADVPGGFILRPNGPADLNLKEDDVWSSFGIIDKSGTVHNAFGFGPDEKLRTALGLTEKMREYAPPAINLKLPQYDLVATSQTEDVVNLSIAEETRPGVVAVGATPLPVTSYADLGQIPEKAPVVGVQPVTPASGWKMVGGTAAAAAAGRAKPLTPEERKALETQRDTKAAEVKELYAKIKDVAPSEMTDEQKATRRRYDDAKRELNEINVKLAPEDEIVAVPGLRVLIDRQSANEYQDILLIELESGNLDSLNKDRKELGLPELTASQLEQVKATPEAKRQFIVEMLTKRVIAEIIDEKKKRIRAEVEKEPVEQPRGEKLEDLYKKYGEAVKDAIEKKKLLDDFIGKFPEPEQAVTDPGYEAVIVPYEEVSAAREKAGSPLVSLEMTIIPEALGTTYDHINELTAPGKLGPMEVLKISGGLRDKMVQYLAVQAKGENTDEAEAELKAQYEKFIEELRSVDANYKPVSFEDFQKNHAKYLARLVAIDEKTGRAKLVEERKALTKEQVEAKVQERFGKEQAEVIRVAESGVPKVLERILVAETAVPPPPQPKPKPGDTTAGGLTEEEKRKAEELQATTKNIEETDKTLAGANTAQIQQLSQRLGRRVLPSDIADTTKRRDLAEELVSMAMGEKAMTEEEREKIQATILDVQEKKISKLGEEQKRISAKYEKDKELLTIMEEKWPERQRTAKTQEDTKAAFAEIIQELNRGRQDKALQYTQEEINFIFTYMIPLVNEVNDAVRNAIQDKAKDQRDRYHKAKAAAGATK